MNPLLKWGGGAYIKIAHKLRKHIEECDAVAEFESQFQYLKGNSKPALIIYICKVCGKRFGFELNDS